MITQNGSLAVTFTSHFAQVFGVPSIDLFVSRLAFQTKPYMAWHPVPGAFAVDTFSVDWGKHFFMHFLPLISLIGFYKRWKPTKPPGF